MTVINMPVPYKHNTYIIISNDNSVGFITSRNLEHPACIGVFACDEWLSEMIKTDADFMSTLKVYPVQQQTTTKKLLSYTYERFLNFLNTGVL